jgi:organic radical activating enzyme
MPLAEMPTTVLWEITYSCPLRCHHCYSESGRRPARHLPVAGMLEIADVLISMQPRLVHIGGGEPMIVKGIIEVISRLVGGGVSVVVSTSGFGIDEDMAAVLARLLHSIHVSIDGPNAEIHDRIRGRAGSFDDAINATRIFDRLAGTGNIKLGIDSVLIRSNFETPPMFLRDVTPRFPNLEFILFNAVAPQGLATRETYVDELLTDAQMALMADPEYGQSLQAQASGDVLVMLADNLCLRMDPESVRNQTAAVDLMILEPDGLVRALPLYEGTVGDIRRDPPRLLWERVLRHREHPFIVDQLSKVRTMQEWSAAARQIDQFFAAPADLIRIGARKPYRRTDTVE